MSLFWLSYGVGLFLTWYENKWIVGDWPLGRPLWYSPGRNQSVLWLVRLALVYGSVAGVWYAHSFWVALVAFGFYYAFATVNFQIYYRRAVMNGAMEFIGTLETRPDLLSQLPDQPPNKDRIREMAFKLAQQRVIKNMKGER